MSKSAAPLLATLSFLGIPNRSRAVRCLIPRSSVPCSAALRVLGGMKRFSLSLQHLVLRWILLVFDAIDDTTPLNAVYNIVMYYIQVDDLVRRMSGTRSQTQTNQPQHRFQYTAVSVLLPGSSSALWRGAWEWEEAWSNI